jgi:PTS system nitrogen regulatory IIA component
MAKDDFDLAGLARYLHFAPQQVERLANRGQVPGRKIAGQWRFSRAEIHHWMEERMGLLEEDELVRMETMLTPSAAERNAGRLALSQMLLPDAIAVPLPARTRGSVIRAMVDLAADTGLLWDPDKMAEAVQAREELQSTAMDIGVALLHPRRPLPAILGEPLLALGLSKQGIAFGGSPNLTDIFFLVASTDDRGHLRTLARLSRLLASRQFLESLRAAETADEAKRVVFEFEQKLE